MFRKISVYFGSLIAVMFIVPFVIAVTTITPQTINTASSATKNVILPTTISVYVHSKNEVVSMNFEEYILNAVMGEMPAIYETEALKAQAVATRSYALSNIFDNKSEDMINAHHGANVCTNFAHCQSFLTVEDANKKWGSDWQKQYYSKIKSAVDSTKGQYLSYNGKVARTFFHANSSGKTENVKDVWGGVSYPYLVSVSSEGDEMAKGFESSVEVMEDDFFNKLKEIDSSVTKKEKMVGQVVKTEGEGVSSIVLFGAVFKGTSIRKIFDLRSTHFEITRDNNVVVFHVKGHGHGVGMSQYGSNCLAKRGNSYKTILAHYYPNTELECSVIR